MLAQPKRRAAEDGGTGPGDAGAIDVGLATLIGNGEDLAPLVRHAFEAGKPDALLHQLRSIVKRKEVKIEDLCKLHYEDFILAVDELRGVLVDADELKSLLSAENLRLQTVAAFTQGAAAEAPAADFILQVRTAAAAFAQDLNARLAFVEAPKQKLQGWRGISPEQTVHLRCAQGRFLPQISGNPWSKQRS